MPLLANPGTAANWGVGATGSAVPANAVYSGLSDGTNLRGWLNATNALNSTGAGLGTAQVIGQFDDVSPTAITENQFGNLRMSANRNAYTTIRDAAGNERGLNVDTNGAIAVTATNATASNLKVAATLDAETTKVIGTVRVLGNAGAIFDGVIGAATAPANMLVAGGVYNSTELSPTTGQSTAIQLDSKGRQRMVIMDAAANTRGANVDANNNLGVVLPAETTKVIGTIRNVGNVGAVFDGVNTAATAPANGILGLGIYNSTEPSPTTGQSVGIQLDSKGRTRTVLMDAAGNTRGANVDASNRLSVSVDAFTATNASTNIAQINGVTPLMGNGATGTGALRVSIASDSTGIIQNVPGTAGGLSWYFVQPTASDNHVNIKNGAGQVYHVAATNNSATINYLRLYNAASGFNGCNSATNLVAQWAVPASTSGAGFVADIAQGITFATGISICVTSGYATNDTTNATASAMSVNVGYK